MSGTVENALEICPFRADVPESAVEDLRRRIAATRWSDRETVPDRSQGAALAEPQELVRYWVTELFSDEVRARSDRCASRAGDGRRSQPAAGGTPSLHRGHRRGRQLTKER
jgi:Epoxide hydrolase N terminus